MIVIMRALTDLFPRSGLSWAQLAAVLSGFFG